MNVLLDTNVLSELRRSQANPAVVRRAAELPSGTSFVSVVTIGEIIYGIERMPAGVKKRSLIEWLSVTESTFSTRIMPVDIETSRIWGEMTARTQAVGRTLDPRDGLIAATAVRHGFQLMTRNIKDFTGTGALLINPWED